MDYIDNSWWEGLHTNAKVKARLKQNKCCLIETKFQELKDLHIVIIADNNNN